MFHINPSQVVAYMEQHLPENVAAETLASHYDIYLAKTLYQIIIDVMNALAFTVDTDVTLEFHESYEKPETLEMERSPKTISPDEYVPEDPLPVPSTSRFDDPDLDYKRRAVEFWRSYKKGYKARKTTRSIQSVKQKFKLVKSISQLHAWKNYLDRGGSRFDKSKLIANIVLDKFREEVSVNNIIHDKDVRIWAQEANRQVGLENFIASRTWLFNFKKNNNITRRSVAKLIVRAKGGTISVEQLESIEQFQLMIKNERISYFGAENVLNVAECSLNSSFSVILVISAAGKLLSPLGITVADGQALSLRKVWKLESQIPELVIIRGGFERQNPGEMSRWFDKVCANYTSTHNSLIVDYKMAGVSELLIELGHRYPTNIDVIPYGTEFMLEPLEEGFKVWRRFVKAINDYIDTTDDCDFDRTDAENMVKIQAFVHAQLSTDRHSEVFKDAWRNFGFLDAEEPAQEHTDPVVYAFGRDIRSNSCSFCSEESFIRCAICEKFICFDHALSVLTQSGFHRV